MLIKANEASESSDNRIRRREFIVGLVGLAAVHHAKAQDRMRRLGVVASPRTEKALEATCPRKVIVGF
jgi:hypothetical protein